MVLGNIIEVKVKPSADHIGDSFRLPRRHSKRLSSTRGLTSNEEYQKTRESLVPRVKGQSSVVVGQDCGWVRVFTGSEEPLSRGTLVYLTQTTTVRDVCRDLLLGDDVTVWAQYGGGTSSRLSPGATPLSLQNDYLTDVGYSNASRRSRLGIDPELRHLIRFHAGPAVPLSELGGLRRSGSVYILKGLVFPQWRRRPVAIVASTLFIYPGVPGSPPEVVDIGGASLSKRTPRQGRLVLRVAPRDGEGLRHVFLGFNHACQLDIWHTWLREAAGPPFNPAQRLDLSDGGLERLPDVLLSFSQLEELITPFIYSLRQLLPCLYLLQAAGPPFNPAKRLDLSDGGLERLPDVLLSFFQLEELITPFIYSLRQLLPCLYLLQAAGPPFNPAKRLDLSDGGLERLPDVLLSFFQLEELITPFIYSLRQLLPCLYLLQAAGTPFNPAKRLDLSDGGLERLPDVLLSFSQLEELILSRNKLGSSSTDANHDGNLQLLGRLSRLRTLRLPGNRIYDFPSSLLDLSSLVLLDISDNNLIELPQDVSRLVSLEELHVDRNELRELPGSLPRLKYLKTLLVACNRLKEIPAFLLSMRTLTTLDLQGNCLDVERLTGQPTSPEEENARLLGRVNLRANLLKGNIILGNYGNLTQLDVSENNITTLDLSALDQLQSVQCSKNQLTELTLHGKALSSLIAGNNRLRKLIISPAPVYLKHLDVSYNDLEMLPVWTAGCHQLRALFASHNKLRALPEHLFCGASTCLQTLQLSYNQLGSLPPFTQPTSLQELFLQSNSLSSLPNNFFVLSTRLRVLNLSNNRLYELPVGSLPNSARAEYSQLEKLYLTANCLTTMALEVVAKFENLRTLHAAYNCFTILPDSCIDMWPDLEELVLSGNKLQYLPENIIDLEHLRVLRVHSNRLQTCPCFGKMTSLKVLDLAHNHLDRVNLATLVPTQLQFLDLSCNSQLFVDPRQFQVYRNQRPMSLVDVSGQNRTCLPSTPFHEGGGDLEPPWKIGFSETAGHKERLYVTQVRLPAFCNTEGLFGMFDGGNNNDVPNILIKAIPRILLEERTVKETASEYMKYTMLSAHRELKEKGQKYGVCATLCHITRTKQQNNSIVPGGHRYVMRVASVGEARALLSRRGANINMSHSEAAPASPHIRTQLGCSTMFPLVIADPHVSEVLLEEQDEFLIIANKRLWEVVSEDEAATEVRATSNPILAAKKLQDLAQGYGCEENLSIMVVKFQGLGSDLEQLMQELRHTIHKGKENQFQTSTCRLGCLCRNDGLCCSQGTIQPDDGFYNNGLLGLSHCKENVKGDINSFQDFDRSSPSGQSDQASSECMAKKDALLHGNKNRHTSVQQHNNHIRQWEAGLNGHNIAFGKSNGLIFGGPQSVLMHENGTRKVSTTISPMERRSYRDSKRSAGGGVLKAIRAKLDGYNNGHLADAEEETGSDQSGTQPSEEQFKCWEYMLEQNTQLLFDKELDTLSRAFARQNVVRPTTILDPLWPQQTSTLRENCKALSRSSPHLSESAAHVPESAPFLSRHFGSARSFNPGVQTSRFNSGRHLLNGGPNAAYFGSLQRLMPYNLEYNFSVIQERRDAMDSLEQDGRMQQYWGVATTEL